MYKVTVGVNGYYKRILSLDKRYSSLALIGHELLICISCPIRVCVCNNRSPLLMTDYSGPRDRYVLGGIHMTNIAFLPNAILKEVTATEYQRDLSSFYNKNFDLEDFEEQQKMMHSLASKPFWLKASDLVSTVTDVSLYLPWWLACNPDRYPYWWGRSEPRLRQLLQAMKSGEKLS